MRRGGIGGREQLVETMSRWTAVSGGGDIEPDRAQTRSRHSSERRGHCVAAVAQILDPLEHQIGPRQRVDVCARANAHALIVRLRSEYDYLVTRAEAEERARILQAEDPDADTHRFFARKAADGSWEVAKIELPQQLRHGKLTPSTEARPRPTHPDDPRSGHEQRAPGFPGGLV
jgi:hypothetical protein